MTWENSDDASILNRNAYGRSSTTSSPSRVLTSRRLQVPSVSPSICSNSRNARASALRPLAHEHGIDLEFSGVDLRTLGNEALLEQAVSNLVENGIRYSDDGGTVNVRVEIDESPEEPCIAVRVSDDGIGISEQDREKIFERFYRTEKSRSKETGGTGLGLAIVKHAALYHGGDIEVESVLGAGSTFTLRLPLESLDR